MACQALTLLCKAMSQLEIGQISGLIHDIKPVSQIVKDLMQEFEEAKRAVSKL